VLRLGKSTLRTGDDGIQLYFHNHNSPLNALSKTLGNNVRPTSGRNSSPVADCNRPKAWAGSDISRVFSISMTFLVLFMSYYFIQD
jgi:hypothetical protein